MELKEILTWHFTRYPLLQAEDIIKLIYQGVFGPGHLVNKRESFREVEERLKNEFARLTPPSAVSCRPESGARFGRLLAGSEETEPVDPDGLLVRVNLAPIANSQTHQVLLQKALKETIKTFTPNPSLFLPRIELAQEWCERYLPSQKERLKLLEENLNFPPSHSEIYLQTYRPAYRVVLFRLWVSPHRI
ncbi:MAG: hypothetical protein ABIK39_04705 [candidate division WOR-3 bacterium]